MISKAGHKPCQKVNTLLSQLEQLEPIYNSKYDHISYNRKWLATQLVISVNDLNNALKPDAPSGAHGHVAQKAIQLTVRLKSIQRCISLLMKRNTILP